MSDGILKTDISDRSASRHSPGFSINIIIGGDDGKRCALILLDVALKNRIINRVVLNV